MVNCSACKHWEMLDSDPNRAYHWMCNNPKLAPLIAPSTNAAVRCNETREFNFACGLDAKWFEPR